jgi:hypothetical protein
MPAAAQFFAAKRVLRGLLGSLGLWVCVGCRTGLLAPDEITSDDQGDARATPDVVRTDCTDATATLVYVVTSSDEILSFDPSAAAFRSIGTLRCPAPPGTSPFSMAVDRRGTAYVVFDDGGLYRVSTKTGACTATSFTRRIDGFNRFGMGFATDLGGPSETLFVASSGDPGGDALASIDVKDFSLKPIDPFVPSLARAELTGTGDGRLFAFYTPSTGGDAHVAQIDKTNAHVLDDVPLPGVQQGRGWAFAFWGGDFWLFTDPKSEGASTVTRYRPGDHTIKNVAKYKTLIVGAGVSTCAPEG